MSMVDVINNEPVINNLDWFHIVLTSVFTSLLILFINNMGNKRNENHKENFKENGKGEKRKVIIINGFGFLLLFTFSLFLFYGVIYTDKTRDWYKDTVYTFIKSKEEHNTTKLINVEEENKYYNVQYVYNDEEYKVKILKDKNKPFINEIVGIDVGVVNYSDDIEKPVLSFKTIEEDIDVNITTEKHYDVVFTIPYMESF